MATISYDKLAGAAPTEAGLAGAAGMYGYKPLSRETTPIDFNVFDYGQATSEQPVEHAFFKQGADKPMVYPGMEDAAFSFEMRTNKGNPAGVFTVAPGQRVRIVDRKSGKVLFEGEGPTGGLQAAQLGEQLSKTQGKKANWRIETLTGNTWVQGAQDKKAKKGLLGKVLGSVLPVAGALLGGPIGIGAIGGAALGGGLGAAAKGKGIGGILKGAALGAGTSALGSAIGGSNALLGKTAGTALGKGIGYGAANTLSGLVQGESLGSALAGGALAGLGTYGLSQLGGGTGGSGDPIGDAIAKSQSTGLFGTGVSAGDALKGLALISSLGGGLAGQSGGGGGGTVMPETGYATGTTGVGGIIPAPVYTGPRDIYALNAYKEGGEATNDNDDDMVRHLLAYEQGLGHQGTGKVSGIGSGQDDLIPAWLSDGEYVWSAQDVADLGDGSTDEGVRRLDQMRELVRKNAGRKNVKKIAKPQQGIDTMLKAVGGRV